METNEYLVRRFPSQINTDDVTLEEMLDADMTSQTTQRRAVPDSTEDTECDGSPMEMAFDQLVVMLSGLYGILLVVIGLVLPTTEAMCNAKSVQGKRFEIFYIYLYVVSILFLVYVYTYLLRNDGGLSLASVSGRFSRRSFKNTSNPSMTSLRRSRNTKIVYVVSRTTGSFYLRMGAIGFGIGSMIHSVITFGHFLEMMVAGHSCSDVTQALKPFIHMCFTFAQMYFVFSNSKMSVHKYKSLARFGLMHMCGTNICVWLRSIVVETLHVIKINERKQLGTAHVGNGSGSDGVVARNYSIAANQYHESQVPGKLPELECHSDAVMGKLQESSSDFLFPCTIEYSLICAGVLWVMWFNVGEGQRLVKTQSSMDTSSPTSNDDNMDNNNNNNNTNDDNDDDDDDEATRRKSNRISVDCASSSQGLFVGVALLVAAICCLIWFYVLIGHSDKVMEASLLGHFSEDAIYLLTLVATIVAAVQMKDMHYSLGLGAGIDEVLTLVSLGGLGLFGVFSIMASLFYLDTLDGQLTVMTNVIMLVQAACQATFILTCLSVSAVDNEQSRQKPGRNSVTFLLVSNFTLWVLNTFETQRLEHNGVQVDFFGANAWSIFSHISVPLGIYYRFHSTVCLSNIWKYAWRPSKAITPGCH